MPAALVKQKPLAPQPNRAQGSMQPAPISGLTVQRTLYDQEQTTALVLNNVLCRRYGVELRQGYVRWAGNMAGEIRTLMSFLPPRENTALPAKLFAVSTSGAVYDVTTQQTSVGAVPPTAVTIGGMLNPGRMSYTMFSAGGASVLVACSNGAGVWIYNGTTWSQPSITGPAAGVVNTFDFVFVWKNRLWFLAAGSSVAWFLPVGQFAGTAQSFDFGPLTISGGEIFVGGSWSVVAASGPDDKLVLVGRGGDVLVYEGTDPTSVSTFRIVGRWFVGRPPVGKRILSKYGGDLAIISSNGIERMSQLTSGRGLVTPGNELGGAPEWVRYMEAIAEDIRATRDLQFWQLIAHPGQQCLIVVTPRNNSTQSVQYVFGTLSGGWSQFIGVPMLSVETHNGDLFFGTLDGKVHLMFSGSSDEALFDGTPGTAVVAELQSAFVALSGDAFHTKRPLMFMPMFVGPAPPSVKAQLNTDWSFSPVPGTPAYNPNTVAKWDLAKWDNAVWAGTGNFYNIWLGAEGMGTHCSLRMNFTGESPGTIFTSWKVVAEVGSGFL